MAYISKYDQLAMENLGSIAQSDLKNHITFTPLGTKKGTEIFGKYNANPCQVMMPVASTWVQVGGTMCYTGEHDFAHISDCNYASNINGYPPTPGYSTYEISYGSVDICGGSGGGFTPGNNTGGGTTPVGGGSGGGIPVIDFDDPCTILKSELQAAKELINKPQVIAQNNIMKKTIVTDLYEKAFCFGINSGEVSDIKEGNSTNVKLDIESIPFNPYGIIHNHNELISYTDFSPADINAFHYYIKKRNTVQYLYVNGADGSMYVMTIQDQDAYDAFITKYPDSAFEANADWKEGLDIRTEEDFLLKYFKRQGKTADEAMDLTLGYLISKYNMGIMISKKSVDGNFQPIQVEKVETTDPLTGKIAVSYQEINPCNL